MKALVVVGHPAPGSFCRALADNDPGDVDGGGLRGPIP